MRKLTIATLLGAALVALLIAGCGSSGDSTTGDSTSGGSDEGSLTKAEFVKQANAICEADEQQNGKEFEELLAEEGVGKNEEPSKAVQEKAVEKIVIPTISGQLEEISDLGFPDEKAEAIVESAEADLVAAEEEPLTLFTGKGFKETNKEARAYGLTVCGEEG